MLLKTLGRFPVDYSVQENQDVKNGVEILDSSTIRTHGGILVDAMGLGKTITTAVFLSILFRVTSPDGPRPRKKYQPTFVICPSVPLLDQWYSTLSNYPSPTVLTSYGLTPSPRQKRGTWISNSAFREAPHIKTRWPASYQYVFDEADPRAGHVIILLTHSTFAYRSTYSQKSNVEEKVITELLGRWTGKF